MLQTNYVWRSLEFNEGEEVAQALKQEDEKVEEGNSVEENERDRKKRALEDVTDANGNRVLQVYRWDITGVKSKMLSRMKKVLNFNILIRRVRRDAETGEEAEDETEDDVEQADIETQVNSSSTWILSFRSLTRSRWSGWSVRQMYSSSWTQRTKRWEGILLNFKLYLLWPSLFSIRLIFTL